MGRLDGGLLRVEFSNEFLCCTCSGPFRVKKGGRRFDGRCLNHTKNRTKSSQDWRSPQVTRVDEIGEISLGVPRTAHGSGSRPVTSARKRLGEATNGAANRKRQALKDVINQYLRSSFQVSLAPVGSATCEQNCEPRVLGRRWPARLAPKRPSGRECGSGDRRPKCGRRWNRYRLCGKESHLR